MKTIVASFVTCFILSSAVGAPKDERPSPTVVATGTDYRKMERVTWEGQPGKGRAHTNGYTELESGMNYQENGEWKATEAKIELVQGGAQAIKGNHKAYFAANLNTRGAIRLTMPSGTELKSHVLGLSFYDRATGKSALIGEIQDSIGEVIPPNQVIYRNAFTDIKADVRYTYKKGGFEQDVILQEQLPAPEEFGLNSDTTVLQVLTEFLEPPVPKSSVKTLKNQQRDETLRFDSMRMGPGTAFSLGEKEGDLEGRFANRAAQGVPVSKSWSKLDGRNFLIEALPFNEAKTHLDKLPAAKEQASLQGKGNKQATASRTLPQMPLAQRQGKQMVVASLPVRNSGFVIDYLVVLDTYPILTDYVFQGDTTYYIAGEVYLFGSVTLEGGAVLKFWADAYPRIYLYDGDFRCLTSMYRPAVFTDMNDDSVGEIIGGSTGTPVIYNGCLDVQDGDFSLSNARFCYAEWPVSLRSGVDAVEIRDVQFVHCGAPVETFGQTISMKNVLMSQSGYPVIGAYYTLNAENCTIDRAVQLTAEWYGTGSAVVNLTNSIVIGVTNLGTAASITTNFTYLRTNYVSGLFQTVGGADYYLATNSIYRNAGTTNISADLLAGLKKRTTYPPIVYSNATLFVSTLSPQAQRDTDAMDLGYHYDPLDYAFGGSHTTNNVTFTAGTAVGWFRTSSGYSFAGHGIHVGNSNTLSFAGTVELPNYFVRCNMVQEGANGLWAGGYGPGGITGWATNIAASPIVLLNFTRCYVMASESSCIFREDYGAGAPNAYITVHGRNSEFANGILGGYSVRESFTNCLMERAAFGMNEGRPLGYAFALSCTFRGGQVGIIRNYTNVFFSLRDCAFDQTAFDVSDSYKNDPFLTDYDYNAFVIGAAYTDPVGANDVLVTNFNWQTSWFGTSYLPSDSALIDTGSLTDAGDRGFYHFTTLTDQSKEANGYLDIGYHYVATDGYGIPLDYDYDSVPDYLEDSNGNGTVDSGETDWQLANELGLRVRITEPKPFSNLP